MVECFLLSVTPIERINIGKEFFRVRLLHFPGRITDDRIESPVRRREDIWELQLPMKEMVLFSQFLDDALRLAKAMTYKSALAENGLGGGKAVIIANPKTSKTPQLLLAFGKVVDYLRGSYIAAEDVGNVAHRARRADALTVRRGDAGAFLSAVLQRVQAEIRHIGGFGMTEDAKDPAFVFELVQHQAACFLKYRSSASAHARSA